MELTAMVDRLEAAIETMQEVHELAMDLSERDGRALVMAGQMTLAVSYLLEVQFHLTSGMDLNDSVLSAARGEMPIGKTEPAGSR